ncbi:MAG: hypothetical protein KBA61_04115 [Spirochaetes bacterium]|nr:hypothetical protein [Spirochaetota bacterium]
MIPKSVLTGVIRDTVKTQSDEKIIEFADLLYSGFARWGDHESRLGEHSSRLDQQHADITHAIESMKAGFQAVDKRFDDLIHNMDKRFTILTWAIGIAFIIINLTMVALKVF